MNLIRNTQKMLCMDLININPLACPWKHMDIIWVMSLHMKTLTDTFITCGHI
ncbi:hypothetical protein NC652_031082 [Populus alba x Populus x berolinensis]|nr:hypothetical protein NC652_031082 [Populus alba x Populus x berolinensis]